MRKGVEKPAARPRSENEDKDRGRKIGKLLKLGVIGIFAAFALVMIAKPVASAVLSLLGFDQVIQQNADRMLDEGRQTFRYDTFGDEHFWGDQLMLHQAIEGERFGGVGPGVSPATALAVGLKVDVDALPPGLVKMIRRGLVDLNDPAVTLALLRHNAVVGVKGFFPDDIQGAASGMQSIGINCALCHSNVDNSLAPGIGHRLDGWANRDLNVGAIVALAPNLAPFADLLGVDQDTVRAVLHSWGPGKFDAELILDGKAFNPQQVSNGVVTGTNVPGATLLPPAFGLAGVNLHTWTGWGSVPYWNAFVANLEMHGSGTFYDPRLNDAAKFPIAAAHNFGDVRNEPDLITPKLAALHYYQLSIPAPRPPDGSFDPVAAERGDQLFEGKANCARCHTDLVYTEPGWDMHTPAEVCIDSFQADRSPDSRYRTSPLKGLWSHQTGGFFHDGRFATLMDVVNHYNTCFNLGLTPGEKSDIVEYLKSL
jgi:mono/diheme cytochrome c family protein